MGDGQAGVHQVVRHMPYEGREEVREQEARPLNLDTYPPGGHHTGTIGFTIRDVLGVSGKKPTMPFDKPGSVRGGDLAKITSWTEAWEAAEKAGAHPAVAADKDDDD